ncbi:hypothetical protein ACFZAU_41100 [Streptomyces sp. NPDC008238]
MTMKTTFRQIPSPSSARPTTSPYRTGPVLGFPQTPVPGPLTADAHCIDAVSAPAWVERIFDDSRPTPLVLISLARHNCRPLLDAAHLAAALAGQATVTVLADRAAGQAMTKRLPDHLDTYGGAVRIFVPNALRDDPHHRHPTVLVDSAQPQDAVQEIMRRIHAIGPAASTIPPLPESQPSRTADITQASADIEKDRLAAEISRLQHSLRQGSQTITELRRERRSLIKQLKDLQVSAGTASHPVLPPHCHADPEEQFRYEVTQIWLWTTPDSERAAQPLAHYVLGPDWLTSLDAVDHVDRRDILEATVDVVARRAAHKPSRDAHTLRTHAAGGAPCRRRADHAVAMRCSIKKNTPAAPRLMWWVRTDQVLELGRVALHDDYKLR